VTLKITLPSGLRRRIKRLFILYKVLFFLFCLPAMAEGPAATGEVVKRRFRVTFYCSCRKCCGRHSPQRGGSGLTALQVVPKQFATVAVGDPSLLGRWLWFDDLGGWVYASDTGTPCNSKNAKRVGCVAADQVDVFVGGPEWHKHAQRLGVQEWEGRYVPLAFDAPIREARR
jgi:hypothetical protein